MFSYSQAQKTHPSPHSTTGAGAKRAVALKVQIPAKVYTLLEIEICLAHILSLFFSLTVLGIESRAQWIQANILPLNYVPNTPIFPSKGHVLWIQEQQFSTRAWSLSEPVCPKQDIGSSSFQCLPRHTFSISLAQSESFWMHQGLKYSCITSGPFKSIVWTQSHTHYLGVLRQGRAILFICVYYQWFRVRCHEILVQQNSSYTLQTSWHVTLTFEKQTSGSFILSLTF